MSTRGAYGFRVDGVDKVTYNHCDSYPTGLGATMVDYAAAHSQRELRALARKLELVDTGSARAPHSLVKRYAEFADLGVSSRDPSEWYVLLRRAQGDPDAWANGLRHMIDSHAFLADSVFCEYAYIINVDDGVLEFYRGFNKDPRAAGRYAALQDDDSKRQGYYGVALIEAPRLASLRRMGKSTRAALASAWEERGDEEDAA